MPEAAKACGLRKGRYSEVGRVYLLTAVVEQRRPVFSDWRAGRLLVGQMRAADQAGMVHSLAWVVMPDHLHWLVELKQGSLAQLMCRVKSRSSRSTCCEAIRSRCGNAAITTELCVAMKILKPLPATLS